MNELCRNNNCPGYNKCNGFPWYDWGDIRWCSHQVWWIIEFNDVFADGIWPYPPEHLEIDNAQKSLSTEAHFVKASMTLAEVEARLLRTGKDGEWLVSMIKLGCRAEELPELPKLAFHYITGWHRYGMGRCPICKSSVKNDICTEHGKVIPIKEKRMGYSDWKKQRIYRRKKHDIELTTKSHSKIEV